MIDGSNSNRTVAVGVGRASGRVDGAAPLADVNSDRRRLGSNLKPGVPPPPGYYRNNLLLVLDHVSGSHGDLLDDEAAAFIKRLQTASEAAQRLYARLVTRKGPQIRLDKLAYREVRNLPRAVDELVQAGLVTPNAPAPADSLLGQFTKDELATLFVLHVPTKRALLEEILGRHTDTAIRARLRALTGWLCVTDRHYLDLVQLLFFGGSFVGGARADLTTFVLEDLGTARFEAYRISREHRLFGDRTHMQRYLAARDLNALTKRVDEHPGVAGAVLAALGNFPQVPTRQETRLLDRARNRLGRWFERAGALDEALASYAGATAHPARERRVRILARQGQEAAVRALLDEIRLNPRGSEEQDFAARFHKLPSGRFGRRRSGRKLPVTNVPMDTGWPGSIETQALSLLERSGGEGWHLENRLPLGLAGLAFWNVIFAPADGAFLNPYQAGPLDLFWEDFATQRQEALASARAELAQPERFARILTNTLEQKAGIVNRLVSWRHLEGYLLDRILETVPHEVLFGLVCHVIENLWRTRTGFPDLLVLYGNGDYEFVEVKGPTDQLQPAQRAWFNHFHDHGCNARVLKFKTMSGGPDQ